MTSEEVLSHVLGIGNDQLRQDLHTLHVNEMEVHVPSPISLLQAKLANVANLVQEGRQDIRHVLILAKLMPNYLEDLVPTLRREESGERKAVNTLERLLNIVTDRVHAPTLRDLNVRIDQMFNRVSSKAGSPIRNFLNKRLPLALKNERDRR